MMIYIILFSFSEEDEAAERPTSSSGQQVAPVSHWRALPSPHKNHPHRPNLHHLFKNPDTSHLLSCLSIVFVVLGDGQLKRRSSFPAVSFFWNHLSRAPDGRKQQILAQNFMLFCHFWPLKCLNALVCWYKLVLLKIILLFFFLFLTSIWFFLHALARLFLFFSPFA